MIIWNVKLRYDFRVHNTVLNLCHYLTTARTHQEDGENSPIGWHIRSKPWYSCQVLSEKIHGFHVPLLTNVRAHQEEGKNCPIGRDIRHNPWCSVSPTPRKKNPLVSMYTPEWRNGPWGTWYYIRIQLDENIPAALNSSASHLEKSAH